MTSYRLTNTPNMVFNISLNGLDFEVTIRSFRGAMYASISSDGIILSAGRRIVSNRPIFPVEVERMMNGSLRVLCSVADVPTHKMFDGTTADFVYIPYGE